MNGKERAMERVQQRFGVDLEACWEWTGNVDAYGYGRVGARHDGAKQDWRVHRLAWEAANGSIPDDLTVDHICRNRLCFNPAHLRLLTRSENSRLNAFAMRTHCPQGHPYDAVNTYRHVSGRHCRRCRADRAARYRRTRPAR